MARRRRRVLQPSDIEGLEYFDTPIPLLARLREIGTQRDRAGNRQLFFDQYISLLLLYFFSPTITSLRGLLQASTLEAVQRRLGIRATSLVYRISFSLLTMISSVLLLVIMSYSRWYAIRVTRGSRLTMSRYSAKLPDQCS